MADNFCLIYHSTLRPLKRQYSAALRQMLLWLDRRVQQKGLTPAMLRDIQAMVCALSKDLALAGDEEMHTVHDRHSSQSLVDKEKSATDDIQVMMQRMTGFTSVTSLTSMMMAACRICCTRACSASGSNCSMRRPTKRPGSEPGVTASRDQLHRKSA